MSNTKKKNKEEIEELKKVKTPDENVIMVPFDNKFSNRFNGILTKLGNGNPMNLISNKVVNVTMSSIYGVHENYQPQNVLNYSNDIKFCSPWLNTLLISVLVSSCGPGGLKF